MASDVMPKYILKTKCVVTDLKRRVFGGGWDTFGLNQVIHWVHP